MRGICEKRLPFASAVWSALACDGFKEEGSQRCSDGVAGSGEVEERAMLLCLCLPVLAWPEGERAVAALQAAREEKEVGKALAQAPSVPLMQSRYQPTASAMASFSRSLHIAIPDPDCRLEDPNCSAH